MGEYIQLPTGPAGYASVEIPAHPEDPLLPLGNGEPDPVSGQ